MKNYAACWMLALSAMVYIAPTVVQAETRNATTPARASAQFGERDNHGNYWDGDIWRSSQWWQSHQGKHLGERNRHGEYWDGGRWSPKKPDSHQGNGHESSQMQGQSHDKTTGRSDPARSPAAMSNHGQTKGNPATNTRPNGEKQKQNQGDNNVTLPKMPQQ